MPGRDRLQEIVKESTDQARQCADSLHAAARSPKGTTLAGVGETERQAHEAISRAADACRVLVGEDGA